VTCDHAIPGFGAEQALAILRRRSADVPVIVVSGEFAEEVAVPALRAGARDFVSKDRLSALPAVVEREVRDAEERRARAAGARIPTMNERWYRSILETAHDWIWSLDLEGRITFSNPGATRVVGYAPEECIGRHFTDFLQSENLAPDRLAFQRVQGGEGVSDYETCLVHRNGSRVHVKGNAIPLRDNGTIVGIVGTTWDVTEARRAEQALRESEERFRAIAEVVSDYTYVLRIGPGGQVDTEWISDSFTRATGYTLDEIRQLGWRNIVHPDDVATVRDHMISASDGRVPEVEARVFRKNGDLRWIRVAMRSVPLAGSAGCRLYAGARDVTEHKQSEAELRLSDRRHKTLVESASELISILDGQGVIRYASPSHEQVLGYSSAELLGRNAFDLLHPDDRSGVWEEFARRIREPGSTGSIEFRYRGRDGAWHRLQGFGKNLLHDPSVEGVVVTSREVVRRADEGDGGG
jgi:PAS domain S-box-containing protein